MDYHTKFPEILTLTKAHIPLLLCGEKGSGKTTLVQQLAEKMKLELFSISMTRQTTLSHLLGFISVNGTYIPSLLRNCFENGGLMLIDEIDAGDPNVLLTLNTIENGFISFPDGIVKVNKKFHLIATANPQDQHQHYTGRTKLDAATLDRFDIIDVDRDSILEQTLVDNDTYRRMTLLRTVIAKNNSSIVISMRDSMRYQKRKDLDLLDGFIRRLVDKSDLILEQFMKAVAEMPAHSDQYACTNIDELMSVVNMEAKG